MTVCNNKFMSMQNQVIRQSLKAASKQSLQKEVDAFLEKSNVSNCLQKKDLSQSIHQSENDSKLSNLSKKKRMADNLPLNLFYSPAEYNRLLIRGQVHLGNVSVPREIGILDNLEYLNQSILLKEQAKKKQRLQDYVNKSKANQIMHKKIISNKTVSCDCGQTTCPTCAEIIQNHTKYASLKQSSRKKNINQKKLKLKKNNHNSEKKVRRSKSCDNFAKKQPIQKCKINTILQNQSLVNKNQNIKKLILQSLHDQAKLKRVTEKNIAEKQQNLLYLTQYNQQIRKLNSTNQVPINFNETSHSKPSEKQPSSHSIGKEYWIKMRKFIEFQLQEKPEIQVAEKTIENPRDSRVTMSIDKMQELRKRHEIQAKARIAQELFAKQRQQETVKSSLQRLERERKKRIKHCLLAPFHPTQEMIAAAFINLNA